MFTRASLPSRVVTLEGKLVGKAHVNALVGSYLQYLEPLPTSRYLQDELVGKGLDLVGKSTSPVFTRASLPSRVVTLEGKLVGKAHVNALVGSYLQDLEPLPTSRYLQDELVGKGLDLVGKSTSPVFTRASLPSSPKLVGKAHVNALVGSYLQDLEPLPTSRYLQDELVGKGLDLVGKSTSPVFTRASLPSRVNL